jgi:endonuclease YncB( thermonuclease family)
MFLFPRLLSAPRYGAGFLLAVLTFVLGVGIGSTVRPFPVGRAGEVSASPAAAPAVPREMIGLRAVYPAEVLHVVDGDTFEARVNLWPGLAVTTRVRLRDIDAPEMKARCAAERVQAEAARDALRRLLDQGGVGITNVTLDKYGGRVLANASTYRTADVSRALLSTALVRPYSGGRRDSWCS